MAFFERADERNKLILCKICKVNCAERSMMTHTVNCAKKHQARFKPKGDLVICEYATNHIVEDSKMEWHQEFCAKRQQQIVSDYQIEASKSKSLPKSTESNSGLSIDDEKDQENILCGITKLNIGDGGSSNSRGY